LVDAIADDVEGGHGLLPDREIVDLEALVPLLPLLTHT
jgi:hypothetical protein